MYVAPLIGNLREQSYLERHCGQVASMLELSTERSGVKIPTQTEICVEISAQPAPPSKLS